MIAAGTATLATPVLAWQRQLSADRGFGGAGQVAITEAGNVVAAGELTRRGRPSIGLAVVKFRGRTGAIMWKRILAGSVARLVLDARGDIVVAATGQRAGRPSTFEVLKLTGADGGLRWRHTIRWGNAAAVATDARGDVVAAGQLGLDDNRHWVVVKLSGASGREVWRHVIVGGSEDDSGAFALAVDTMGDVVAAGRVTNGSTTTSMATIKLGGADGHEIWRSDLPADASDKSSGAAAVQLDATGDVIVAGFTGARISPLQSDFFVAKLAGTHGVELWRHVSASDYYGFAADVAVDGNGAVIAVGEDLPAGGTHTDFATVKLDGADGRELWRVLIDGPRHVDDGASAVAVDASGNAFVAGWTQSATTGVDLLIVKFTSGGAELSRETIANAGSDHAGDIAIDRRGQVIAVGSTSCGEPPSYFTVFTLPVAEGGRCG